MKVTLKWPWLIADLATECRTLSWALNRPGFAAARRIVWREVRNADLPPNLDAKEWYKRELQSDGYQDTVGLLTSRAIQHHHFVEIEVGNIRASCLATVGLSNAERVGTRIASMATLGTINIAVELSAGLTDAALIEALSIATQARTTAVIDHGPDLACGRATGTGTDCVVIAAPNGETPHAGLHTDIGEAIGRAVLGAVSEGVSCWMTEQEGKG